MGLTRASLLAVVVVAATASFEASAFKLLPSSSPAPRCPRAYSQCYGLQGTAFNGTYTCCPARWRCTSLNDGAPRCEQWLAKDTETETKDVADADAGADDTCCSGLPATPGAGHTVCCGAQSTCGYLDDGFPMCRGRSGLGSSMQPSSTETGGSCPSGDMCYGLQGTGFSGSYTCCPARWRCTSLNDGAPRCEQWL